MHLIADFLKTAKKPLIVVLGPTASGKTALSIKIAKDFNGEIISTDSRQIYRQMEIGTDAITESDQQGIAHHLLAIADPDETVTLADYRDHAKQKIEEIYGRSHIPMLVGGTGLYIDSIINSYDMPRIPPDPHFRKKIEQEAKTHGNEYLHAKLKKIDPQSAEEIHPNNLPYVIRALEIYELTGKPKSAQISKSKPEYDVFMIGIEWPRDQLYERIKLRVENQLKRGLVDEVRRLLEKGYDKNLPSMSSLGVKEIIPFIEGEMPLSECVEILERSTRRYAKRQMTWFRRYDKVNWLTPEELEEYLKH